MFLIFILSFADILIPYLLMCFFIEYFFEQKKLIVVYGLSLLLHMFNWHFIMIQLCILIIYIVINKDLLSQYHINYIHILLLFFMFHVLTAMICHIIISVVINIPFTFEDIFYLNDYSYVIYELIVCLILFTIINVRSLNNKMSETKNKLYMAILGISIGLCLLLIQSYLNIMSSIAIYSCLLGIFLYLSFTIFSFFKENLNTKIENEQINEQYKLNRIQLQGLLEKEQYYEELQKFKHDIKNNLLTLLYLYENNDYLTAQEYLEKLTGKLENTNLYYSISEHPIINAILNDKIRKNTHIQFHINCKCSKNIFIEDLDLNILLSNLLDNAIEYLNTNEIDHKFIDMTIIEHKNMIIISIKNPINELFQHNNGLKTTKKDKNNHGYGLSIVKNVVNQYHGHIELESTENIFHVNVLLKGGDHI